MKKIILLLIILFSISNCAQTSVSETNKLATTAKIWGFLKYYHPAVGEGKFNWDDQLFEILPKLTEAKNKQELSSIYLQWIESLGNIEICTTCTSNENKDYFGKNFDLSWIKDSTLFSQKLISKLVFIEENRFQGNHHYVSTFEGVGNIRVQNEPEYPNFTWDNRSLRLLSLFQYWNYIEYFFPYKYQMDKDWDDVLKESIPNFLNPNSETDYHLAMLELIVNINDSHGYFSSEVINDYFGENSLPVKLNIIGQKAIVTDFYNEKISMENDLQIGDVVLKVNGKTIETILAENMKYFNGSNISVKNRNAARLIFNGSETSVKIQFERNGKLEDKTVKRYPYYQINFKNPKSSKWNILDNNIGYVNMGELEVEDVKMVMDTLSTTKVIIFDIRNYPKGTMYAIAEYLNKSPQEFAKFIIPDLSYPGKFNWTQSISCGKSNAQPYPGKVILLVNEITQSHAEFTTMCLQTSENSIIIGSQTSGADGNVSRINLVGGFETMFTGIGVFYPNGKETQRIGIVPDIEVYPTIQGIKKGKDEVLERAIELALE